MDWISAASSVLTAAAGSPDPQSGAATPPVSNVFDGSGWTVNQRAGLAGVNPYLIGGAILAATLVAIVWIRKR